MIVDRINKYLAAGDLTLDEYIIRQVSALAGWTFRRQFMENGENHAKLSLSGAGKCPRQLAYKYHDIPKAGKEIDSRAKIIFWQGDLVENMIMHLAKLAGCRIMATGFDQLTCSVTVKKQIPYADPEPVEIPGHPDGILLADKTYLVECKSMSSFAFSRFEKGIIDDSYQAQISMYLHALHLDTCVMIALNKDNGVLHEMQVEKNAEIVDKCMTNLEMIINSTHEGLPERAYKADDKGFYPWQCLYCSWWKTCLPEAEQVVVSGRYKLKAEKKSR